MCYDRANSKRYKTVKWIEIAQTLEQCHLIRAGYGGKLPVSVDRWVSRLAKHLGVA